MVNMANVGSVFKEGACNGPGNFSMTVDSTTIDSLKRKDIELKKEIDKIKESINNNVGDKLNNLQECCEENREKNKSQDSQIGEINTNISFLKGRNTKQDKKIDALGKNVIVDSIYKSFQEWFQNVYMKAPSEYIRKSGDMYINVNINNSAKRTTYIYSGLSINKNSIDNWVELEYSSPADKLTILGIDPIKVDHKNMHEWIISMDPDKLAKLISQLPRLDLSKTEIKLGKVFTTPIYKDDATFELNITVEGDTILNNLTVNGSTTLKDVAIETLNVQNVTSEHVHFHHDITVQENLTIANQTDTGYLSVNKNAKINNLELDNEIRINVENNPCSGQYYDFIQAVNGGSGIPQSKYVSINQSIFQPSFAKFVISSKGEKHGDRARLDTPLKYEWDPSVDGAYRSRLIALGGDMAGKSVLSQPFNGAIGDLIPMGYNTPDIFRLANSNMIFIANSGVYDISYIYNFSQSKNIWANRAGLALIRMGSQKDGFSAINGVLDLQIEDLVDNKWEGSGTKWEMAGNLGPDPLAWEHKDTTYSGSDYTYKDSESDIKRITGLLGMSVQTWSASGSTLVEIPCGEVMCLVPYIKPSAAGGSDRESLKTQYPEFEHNAWLTLKNGKRDSGALSQINIKKVANATTQSTANGRTII